MSLAGVQCIKKSSNLSARSIIVFNLPNAVSPAQYGVSGDKRLPGIAVRQITLHELGTEKEILSP